MLIVCVFLLLFVLNVCFVKYIGSSVNSVSQYQFKIVSYNVQSTYYYYPCQSQTVFKNFESFNEDITAAISSTSAAAVSAAAAVATGDDDPSTLALTPSYAWLETYRREDQSAIERSIADGTVTLKKRESKFREELERHEYEYIVYKDFR